MAECYTEYIVSRYDWYPSDSPTGICVGFTAKCTPNGRSNYWEVEEEVVEEEEVIEEEEETILQPIAEGAAPASTVNTASNAYD
jgi:hypothetical protein